MSDEPRVLVYGATGYTGRLVLAEALRRGLPAVAAGRSRERVAQVAASFDVEARAFDLTERRRSTDALRDVDVVLHCAGPFTATAEPMVRACLDGGTHYLDITGEVEVFDGVYAHHEAALDAGVALVPGVGFDIVPTDHLVARLVTEVPDAHGADVAVISRGGFSRGTLRTAAAGVGAGNRIRRGGELVEVAHAHRTRDLQLGGGTPQRVATTPLGDVASAHHGYGLADVATFTAIPVPGLLRTLSPVVRRTMSTSLGARTAHRALGLIAGPDDATRERTRSTGWAHVYDASGHGLEYAVEVSNTYTFTARSMVHAAVTLAQASRRPAGALTPANALGRDFLATIPGADLSWPTGPPRELTLPGGTPSRGTA